MLNPLTLILIEVIGFGSCAYSLLFLNTGRFSFFFYGLCSTACAILNCVLSFLPVNVGHRLPDLLYTFRYTFASYALVAGYPSLVYDAWMVHYSYPPITDFFGLILPYLLLIVAIRHNIQGSELWTRDTDTKFAVRFAMTFHIIISLLFWNVDGQIRAGIMNVVLLGLSLRPRGVYGFSAEDLYFTGLSAAFVAFSLPLEEIARNLLEVAKLKYTQYYYVDIDKEVERIIQSL